MYSSVLKPANGGRNLNIWIYLVVLNVKNVKLFSAHEALPSCGSDLILRLQQPQAVETENCVSQ